MQPNASITSTATSVQPYRHGTFEEYVTYCALGGLITSDDGVLSKMTLSQFCQQFGINRKTAYRWRQQTPDFGERVRRRREEIFPLARESACWNQLYLIGVTSLGENGHGDHKAAVQALKLMLGHFGGLRLASAKQQDIEGRQSWSELLNLARKRDYSS